MGTKQMRDELIQEISTASSEKIKSIYNLFKAVSESLSDDTEWKSLPVRQRQKIETGLSQLKEGKTISADDVLSEMKAKYVKQQA